MEPLLDVRKLQVQTERLLVRPLAARDREEWVRVHAASEELFRPWYPAREPGTALDDVFTSQIERAAQGLRDGSQARFVGVLADGRIGGFFNLSDVVYGVFRNGYAGWSVNVEVAGRGIATEGVRALLDLAFAPPPEGLGLHRVQANVIPTNGASLRVAQKAGFRREGLALRYLRIAGKWRDHVMFAKLADEHTLRDRG